MVRIPNLHLGSVTFIEYETLNEINKMPTCTKHKLQGVESFNCPVCITDERDRLIAERDRIREAAENWKHEASLLRAEVETLRKGYGECKHHTERGGSCYWCLAQKLKDAELQLRDARNATLEEVAQKVETPPGGTCGCKDPDCRLCIADAVETKIAEQIRQMKG